MKWKVNLNMIGSIKCIGRRSIEVSKMEDKFLISLFWKENKIAELVLERKEANKLLNLLAKYLENA